MEFSPPDFRDAYPEFQNFTDNQLNNLWIQALTFGGFLYSIFLKKDIIFYYQQLILAHICALSQLHQSGDSRVGRISSATEGSVSGSFDYPMTSTSAWWQQTQYGATIYQIMIMHGGYTYVSWC